MSERERVIKNQSRHRHPSSHWAFIMFEQFCSPLINGSLDDSKRLIMLLLLYLYVSVTRVWEIWKPLLSLNQSPFSSLSHHTSHIIVLIIHSVQAADFTDVMLRSFLPLIDFNCNQGIPVSLVSDNNETARKEIFFPPLMWGEKDEKFSRERDHLWVIYSWGWGFYYNYSVIISFNPFPSLSMSPCLTFILPLINAN